MVNLMIAPSITPNYDSKIFNLLGPYFPPAVEVLSGYCMTFAERRPSQMIAACGRLGRFSVPPAINETSDGYRWGLAVQSAGHTILIPDFGVDDWDGRSIAVYTNRTRDLEEIQEDLRLPIMLATSYFTKRFVPTS